MAKSHEPPRGKVPAPEANVEQREAEQPIRDASPLPLDVILYPGDEASDPNYDGYQLSLGRLQFPIEVKKGDLKSTKSLKDARVQFQVVDDGGQKEKAKIRVTILGDKLVTFECLISKTISRDLLRQTLTTAEEQEIRDSMYPEYWKERAKETEHGVIEYPADSESAKRYQVGVAVDKVYGPDDRHKDGRLKTMEDRVLIDPDNGLFGVFDGMGGHSDGDVAATIAAEKFSEIMSDKQPFESTEWRLRRAFAVADEALRAYQEQVKLEDMPGTTGSVAYVEHLPGGGRRAWIGSVGDSRVYLGRADGAVYQLTVDDARDRKTAMMSEIARQRDPKANVIANYIGRATQLLHYADNIPIRSIDLQPEEFLILTSDGVHDIMAANERDFEKMEQVIQQEVHNAIARMFGKASAQDVQRAFLSGRLTVPLLTEFETSLREAVLRAVETDRTLADAVSEAVPKESAQKIAEGVLRATEETHQRRIKTGDVRKKRDNRSVLVVK